MRGFLASLDFAPEDQIVREFVARSASTQGAVLTGSDLVTVDLDRVYWHPIMGEDL